MSFLEVPVVLGEAAGVAEEAAMAGSELSSAASAVESVAAPSASTVTTRTEGVGVRVSMRGARKVELDLARMRGRMRNVSPAGRRLVRLLEIRERAMFTGRRYTNTGRLRRSLTQRHAPGAIRKITSDNVLFGSSVWYGRFQVEDPGPVTEKGGLKRVGHPSAILKPLTPTEAHEMTRSLGEWIMRGKS